MSPKFPCKKVLDLYKNVQKPVMNPLYGTFGTDVRCINSFIDRFRGRSHMVLIYLVNGSCRRMRRCDRGEIYPKASVARFNILLERKNSILGHKIKKRVERIRRDIVLAPRTKVVLSMGLEDEYSTKAYNSLKTWINETWPAPYSRNPLRNPNRIRWSFLESHGMRPSSGAKVCTNDGIDLDSRSIITYKRASRHCQVRIFWDKFLQGRDGRFVVPYRRTFRLPILTRKLFREFIRKRRVRYVEGIT